MRTQGLRRLTALMLVSGSLQAAPLASVESLQPPVWVERGGTRTALSAGAELKAGDQFFTGAGGRLHITMSDQSVVKLGENGRLDMPRLELKPVEGDEGGLLSSALNVVKGAFRFTTRELGKLRKREVDIAIGPTITAGIRGTDVWGKSDPSQELLCLIEGRIEIGSPGHDTQVMDQAATFYVVPRDAAPLPVAPVPEGKLATWSPQTEMAPEAASLTATGGYIVGVESSTNSDGAQATVKRLSDLGYPAEIMRAQVGGHTWYRVVVTGLQSQAEARRFSEHLKQAIKLKSPWVMAPPKL